MSAPQPRFVDRPPEYRQGVLDNLAHCAQTCREYAAQFKLTGDVAMHIEIIAMGFDQGRAELDLVNP